MGWTRWADLPPVWTAAHLAALWLGRGLGPRLDGPVWDGVGAALAVLGLALMVWAVAVMARHRTTVIPHRVPDALVTTGPFAFSRNPIYLGDVLVLGGAVFWAGTVWGVLLIPSLVAILTRRFILPEEARLRAGFGAGFYRWRAGVRRWV